MLSFLMKLFLLLFSLLLFFPCNLYAEDVVRYFDSAKQEESSYYIGLLTLILKNSTDEFGDYSLGKSSILMN